MIIIGLLLVAACGRKGPPVAPERRLPLPPTALTATVGPGEVVLGWTNPTRRADRARLRDLEVLRLYRVSDTGEGEPKPAILSGERVVGYTLLAAIRPDHPEPAVIEGGQVRYVDRRDLEDGKRYTYVVTASDSQGRTSPPSQRVSVFFVTATEPPAGLTAQAGDGRVELAWQPPAALSDGRPLGAGTITYEVLRVTGPEVALAPITPAPIAATRHTDAGVENDQTFSYAVRAIRAAGGGRAASRPSATVAATPRRTTAPAPPSGLVAAVSPGRVSLFWNPSAGPDVAGYVVYRGVPGGELVRVARVLAPATEFVDRDVPPGTYRYAVSAFDSAAIPNESARSPEAVATAP